SESLNFAVLKKLPILFVCENNQYAIHTHQWQRQGQPNICARAAAHGLPAERLDGADVPALRARTQVVVARLRAGKGPWFFEVSTHRWREHGGPGCDYPLGSRTGEEARPWEADDPVRRMSECVEPGERARLEQEVEEEIAAAFAFAEASPFPPASELATDVFEEEQHEAVGSHSA